MQNPPKVVKKKELAEYLTNKWLIITYKNGYVTALKCSVSTRYDSKINYLKQPYLKQ